MAEQKQGDQLEPTYSSSVKIRDVALRTCQKRWTIGRSDERGSEISVLVARQDDDDEMMMIVLRSIINAHENIISTDSGGVWRKIWGLMEKVGTYIVAGVMVGGGKWYLRCFRCSVVSFVFCFFFIGVELILSKYTHENKHILWHFDPYT